MKERKSKLVVGNIVAILIICSLVLLNVPTRAQEVTEGGYLVAYFRSDPSQTGEKIQKLHYGYSRNGVHFYELNNNLPVANLNYPLRDPFIDKGPDGIWRLVYTSPDVDSTGKNIPNYYLGYAESTDLIHWTNQKRLDLMHNFRPANTVYNTWAPEWTYNDETGKYIIYWSSTLNATAPIKNKHYKATTTDWNTFSNASILFDPGYSTIDANIVRYDKNGQDFYYMFFKDEGITPMKNRQTWASEPVNKIEYEANISSNTITPDYTEGPEVFKLIGQNSWNLIYDYWSQGKYGLKSTTNIENPTAWSAENANARFPFKMRHAGVATLNEAELWKVVNAYSLEAHYELNSNVNDTSGNGHHGWLSGSPVFSSTGGVKGGYIQLDGMDDGVQLVADTNSGFMHDSFITRSISMWIKADNTTNTQILYDEGGATSGFGIKLENGNLVAGAASAGVRKSVSTAFTDTSAWHHVTAVFEDVRIKLFLDGELKGSLETGFNGIGAHSDHGGIGERFAQDAFGGTQGGANFAGKIDEVKIYTVPLFNKDVEDLYLTP